MARPGEIRSLKTLEYVLGTDPAVVRGFATAAADQLANGPLTLAARSRLLGRGERLGMRRFDANLVVAAVEHRRRTANPAAARLPASSPPTAGWWPPAVAFALQTVIVTAAWWLLA